MLRVNVTGTMEMQIRKEGGGRVALLIREDFTVVREDFRWFHAVRLQRQNLEIKSKCSV